MINNAAIRAAEGAGFSHPAQSIGNTRSLTGYDFQRLENRQAVPFIAPANTTPLRTIRLAGLGGSNLHLITRRGLAQRIHQAREVWYMPAVLFGRSSPSLAVNRNNENDTVLGRNRNIDFRQLTMQDFGSIDDAVTAFGLAFSRLSEIERREYGATIVRGSNGFRIRNIHYATFDIPNFIYFPAGSLRNAIAIVHTPPPPFCEWYARKPRFQRKRSNYL